MRDARALQRAPVREHLGPRLDRKVANRPVPREPGVRPAAGIEDTDGGLDLYPTTHRPSMSARSQPRSQHGMAGKAGKCGCSVAGARYDEAHTQGADGPGQGDEASLQG